MNQQSPTVGTQICSSFPPVGTREELVRRAEALIPVLRERTSQADALRRLPDETTRDLKRSGVARILQPSQYGGCEASFAGMVDILRAIGRGCGSTTWCLAQYIGHNFMVAQWQPEAQEAVWGQKPDNLVSGILMPLKGKAHKVDGGYRLTGRWPLVSGVDISDWCITSGMVTQAGSDPQEERYFLVPREQFTILPTWDAIGLQGSGSNDIEVTDLFIPEHMSLPLRYLKGGETPGNVLHPAPLYRSPSYMWFGILLSSASVGMAEGMLADYVAQVKAWTSLMSGRELHKLTSQHLKVAEAEASIESAKAVLYAMCDEIMTMLEARKLPTNEQRTKYRCIGAFAGRLAFSAANAIWDASGARGVYMENPLARTYRDLCTATRHFTHSWDTNAAIHGQVKLGLPLDNPAL